VRRVEFFLFAFDINLALAMCCVDLVFRNATKIFDLWTVPIRY
jgi:hypothetical protein